MSKYAGKYTGRELLATELKGTDPLIEKVLFERDNIIILGKEKSSKSILSLQMACALTSQEPFLGEFNVPTKCSVVYIQCEGKLASTQNNFRNMTKSLDCDLDNILFLYYPSIELDTEEGVKKVCDEIDSWKRPDVIFVDCLYMAMRGKMEDSTDAKRFVSHIRLISEYYQCTIPLVHHSHRIKVVDGKVIDESDDSIFGSFVWKAYPEHILLLEKVRGHSGWRKLSCATHRSSGSDIIDSVDLVLVEPSPLYFDFRNDQTPSDKVVLSVLGNEPFTREEISTLAKIHPQTTWSILKKYQNLGIITNGLLKGSKKSYLKANK